MATPTYDPIASTTLTSSAASVTFSSLDTIAAGYRDLIVVMTLTAPGSAVFPSANINGSTSDFSYVRMSGNGSSASSGTGTSYLPFGGYIGPNQTVQATFHFFDFAQTDKHKSFLIRQDNADASTEAYAYRWANTTAITSLGFTTASGNYPAGTIISLYGIVA